jgi:hypothetical protein
VARSEDEEEDDGVAMFSTLLLLLWSNGERSRSRCEANVVCNSRSF